MGKKSSNGRIAVDRLTAFSEGKVVNPDQLKIFLIVICKSVMTKKWLNMVTLLSRIDFNLFRLSFLTQGKFMLLSKVCLGSRFVISLLLLKVRPSRLKLTLL